MTGIEIRLILYVLLAVAAIFGVRHYNDLRARAERGDLRGQVIERTSTAIMEGEKADEELQQDEARVAQSRAAYQAAPKPVDRSHIPFPVSLRNLSRERRLARERSGSDEGSTAAATQTANAAER